MELKSQWEFVSDTVMGGVSQGRIEEVDIFGRHATRLKGDVSLDNNGGFVQMAFDINDDVSPFDASGWDGLKIDVLGNDETYDLRLRTSDLTRPWQSYRATFIASSQWTTISIPFANFTPHKTDTPLNRQCLRRIGILAIGRVFSADVSVSCVRLY